MSAYRRLAFAALLASATLAAGAAGAAETGCPAHFAGGVAPDVLEPKMTPRTRELCYAAFAALHSGLTRTPLWSAERLTRDGVAEAKETVRENSFHPDPNLPRSERAELSDYAGSGYDRGHMAPSGDMPDAAAQNESFSLANMIPQAPRNNRGIWAGIESATRYLAKRDGEVYVVTGPIFAGSDVQALKGRVLVPTRIFKAVYDPKRGQAAAFLVDNADDARYVTVSIEELTRLSHVDPFPGIDSRAKASMLKLPEAHPSRLAEGAPRAGESSSGSGGAWSLAKMLWKLIR